MPRTTREWSHRKLDEAVNNLDWAIVHLEDIRQRYSERPEILDEPVQQIQALILVCSDTIKKLKGSY